MEMELQVKSHTILLDPNDYDTFKDKTLNINSKGYATHDRGKQLHRTIMDCPKDKVIDHINQDKLDNRKANLRICTIGENNLNKPLSNRNKVGYTGVHFYKPLNKYMAYISKDKKRHHLGYFETAEEAYYKYCAVAKNLHGEYTAERIKNIAVEPCEIKPKEYKSPPYVLEYYKRNKDKKAKDSLLRSLAKTGKRPRDTTIEKHKLTEAEIQEWLDKYSNV